MYQPLRNKETMNYFISNSEQSSYGIKKIRMQEMLELLQDEKVLGCDSETTGLSHVDNEMLLFQISTTKDNFIVDAQSVSLNPLKGIMASEGVLKIFHNAAFDVKFLLAMGIPVENVWDTMLMEQSILLGTDISCSLKDVLFRYKGIQADKEVRNTFINHSGEFTEEQLKYAAEDTEHLIEIMETQKEQIKKLDIEKVAALENEAVLAFADCTFNGLYLDQREWVGIYNQSKHEVDTIEAALNTLLVSLYLDKGIRDKLGGDLFGEIDVNWNSPKQVLEHFQLIIPELESVGAPVLKPYRREHPIIDKYIKYKEAQKKANAYGIKFISKYIHSDGKIHPGFRQMVSTGRTSSSGPRL